MLRQIIKGKHEWLLLALVNELKRHDTDFPTLEQEKQEQHITSVMHKRQAFRQFLLGSIVGEFGLEEIKSYYNAEKAINKRILSIIEKRFLDSLNELCRKLS